MRLLNHKIQILQEVVVLLIRLKVVEVKTLFSLAGSLEVGRGPPSKFLKFFFQSNTVRHIFGLDRFFFVASLVCHNIGFVYTSALHQQVFRYLSAAHRLKRTPSPILASTAANYIFSFT